MLDSPQESIQFERNVIYRLRQRLADARQAGFRIRTEWLGGETTGWCEYGGSRWIFVDLSLSVAEQLSQLDEALRSFESQRTSPLQAAA
ncbi:hypothetical protein FF011L_08790 [Roseimaritima multifibrata]|uniref:Uncharacterized protein n=1 Tax=Roseimaritima multifibrata TaxID=1930274 RepID=A0A517MB75_9BACT|nr:hypothetical protein [Roseimaritima multifibrata]QDS92143.1 hypothetical protein FF011L_08790 [Roseimaritima multifibrata]